MKKRILLVAVPCALAIACGGDSNSNGVTLKPFSAAFSQAAPASSAAQNTATSTISSTGTAFNGFQGTPGNTQGQAAAGSAVSATGAFFGASSNVKALTEGLSSVSGALSLAGSPAIYSGATCWTVTGPTTTGLTTTGRVVYSCSDTTSGTTTTFTGFVQGSETVGAQSTNGALSWDLTLAGSDSTGTASIRYYGAFTLGVPLTLTSWTLDGATQVDLVGVGTTSNNQPVKIGFSERVEIGSLTYLVQSNCVNSGTFAAEQWWSATVGVDPTADTKDHGVKFAFSGAPSASSCAASVALQTVNWP